MTSDTPACERAFAIFSNPIAVGDDPALTQNLGWTGAWSYAPSAFVVAAETTKDVQAAVNFARHHHLRLVVKGGGHSYQGTSSAPDSLLIWTRHMNQITLHDAFVPAGGHPAEAAQAVSIGAGCVWLDAYRRVTSENGRYVQGGGCTTVGVAGHVQSGGFGSFSKGFGTAASNLLEAEIVTADGRVRVVNEYHDPELFWALKGGGGGSFGVVTRLTLVTFDAPEKFGVVNFKVLAADAPACRQLVTSTLTFYRDHLANPHWGEQIIFDGTGLEFKMVFQGLDKATAAAVFKPYLDWIGSEESLRIEAKPVIQDVPPRAFWNADILSRLPGLIQKDDRPGADPGKFVWPGDAAQCGRVWSGYQSQWLEDQLLEPDLIDRFTDALVAAASIWTVELHFNKGLSGADQATLERVRNTATNALVMRSFALAIIAGSTRPSLAGAAGFIPDEHAAQRQKVGIDQAMQALRSAVNQPGSYVAESDFFMPNWQESFFGDHVGRLQAAKMNYDPEGLFFVHHGIGSECWSADGFLPV
jgi:hypothetical protein